MPEISKIQLPSGSIYDIKDAVARQTLSGAIIIRGVTTTALTDECTTNPITIDGNSYTAVANDAVFYQKKEFLFDGTKWHELGDISGTVTGVKGNSESTYRTGNVNLTAANIGAAASSHSHGNITSGGDITATAPTIASGDQIIINDDSASKITNGPTFDGSTTTKALTPKGTWETFLQSHQTIKQDGVTGATVNRYASCSTASNTAAKTASITTGTFSLEAGSIVNVKFTNANSASTPTLNINSTGAKNIFSNGVQITSGSNKGLLKGLCTFIYDGTQYHLIGNYLDTDTHYTTHLYAGTGTAANAATTNGNTKVTVADNTTARDSVTIKGTGATSVSSDANGVITIYSDSTDSWSYDEGSFLEGITTISGLNSGIEGFIDGKLAYEYMNIPCGIIFSSSASSQNITPFEPGHHYQGFIYHMEGSTSSTAEYAVVLFDVATGDIFVNAHTSSETWGTWRKTGALAWKNSGTYDKTTGGSASVSLKIPTSKTVALSVTTSAPASSAATGEVGYVASVTNETLTLNKIICTTGGSITVPSSATAYTGTITPTHTSTNVTFS